MALGQSSVVDRDAALRQALERGGSLTPAELRAELGVSKTTGRRILDGLVSKGVVSRAGTGRGSRYLVAGRAAGTDLSSRALLAIDLAKERGPISRRDFEAAAGVSSRTAKRELAELAGRGALVKVGTGKNAAYRLAAE
jgi:predicted HTH transcriptional regulator